MLGDEKRYLGTIRDVVGREGMSKVPPVGL